MMPWSEIITGIVSFFAGGATVGLFIKVKWGRKGGVVKVKADRTT